MSNIDKDNEYTPKLRDTKLSDYTESDIETLKTPESALLNAIKKVEECHEFLSENLFKNGIIPIKNGYSLTYLVELARVHDKELYKEVIDKFGSVIMDAHKVLDKEEEMNYNFHIQPDPLESEKATDEIVNNPEYHAFIIRGLKEKGIELNDGTLYSINTLLRIAQDEAPDVFDSFKNIYPDTFKSIYKEYRHYESEYATLTDALTDAGIITDMDPIYSINTMLHIAKNELPELFQLFKDKYPESFDKLYVEEFLTRRNRILKPFLVNELKKNKNINHVWINNASMKEIIEESKKYDYISEAWMNSAEYKEYANITNEAINNMLDYTIGNSYETMLDTRYGATFDPKFFDPNPNNTVNVTDKDIPIYKEWNEFRHEMYWLCNELIINRGFIIAPPFTIDKVIIEGVNNDLDILDSFYKVFGNIKLFEKYKKYGNDDFNKKLYSILNPNKDKESVLGIIRENINANINSEEEYNIDNRITTINRKFMIGFLYGKTDLGLDRLNEMTYDKLLDKCKLFIGFRKNMEAGILREVDINSDLTRCSEECECCDEADDPNEHYEVDKNSLLSIMINNALNSDGLYEGKNKDWNDFVNVVFAALNSRRINYKNIDPDQIIEIIKRLRVISGVINKEYLNNESTMLENESTITIETPKDNILGMLIKELYVDYKYYYNSELTYTAANALNVIINYMRSNYNYGKDKGVLSDDDKDIIDDAITKLETLLYGEDTVKMSLCNSECDKECDCEIEDDPNIKCSDAHDTLNIINNPNDYLTLLIDKNSNLADILVFMHDHNMFLHKYSYIDIMNCIITICMDKIKNTKEYKYCESDCENIERSLNDIIKLYSIMSGNNEDSMLVHVADDNTLINKCMAYDIISSIIWHGISTNTKIEYLNKLDVLKLGTTSGLEYIDPSLLSTDDKRGIKRLIDTLLNVLDISNDDNESLFHENGMKYVYDNKIFKFTKDHMIYKMIANLFDYVKAGNKVFSDVSDHEKFNKIAEGAINYLNDRPVGFCDLDYGVDTFNKLNELYHNQLIDALDHLEMVKKFSTKILHDELVTRSGVECHWISPATRYELDITNSDDSCHTNINFNGNGPLWIIFNYD